MMLRGYSTLIGVVLLLAFLTTIILGIHMLHVSNLQSISYTNGGNQALKTGESCVEETLRRLKTSLGYTGGTIPLGAGENCTASITGDITQKIINATYSSNNYQKNLQVTVDISIDGSAINFIISDWQEL